MYSATLASLKVFLTLLPHRHDLHGLGHHFAKASFTIYTLKQHFTRSVGRFGGRTMTFWSGWRDEAKRKRCIYKFKGLNVDVLRVPAES